MVSGMRRQKERDISLFLHCSTSAPFHLSFMSPWWCPWHWVCKLSIHTITHRLRAGIIKQYHGCIMSTQLNEVVSEVMLCGKEKSMMFSQSYFSSRELKNVENLCSR